jgi:NADPH-dependent ferric siderophore reductase
MAWPGGEDALTVRVYTIREIDAGAGWVDVDFVLHEDGDTPAATFAEKARPGDVIGMIGPGGGGVPESRNLLLLGDDTAMPAISRILAEMPAGTAARAIVEVNGPADAEALSLPGGAEITWLYREGREPGTTRLLPDALAALDPATLPDDLFVWAGCEFAAFREIRATLRKGWGLKKDRHLAVAYWRRGVGGEAPSDEH